MGKTLLLVRGKVIATSALSSRLFLPILLKLVAPGQMCFRTLSNGLLVNEYFPRKGISKFTGVSTAFFSPRAIAKNCPWCELFSIQYQSANKPEKTAQKENTLKETKHIRRFRLQPFPLPPSAHTSHYHDSMAIRKYRDEQGVDFATKMDRTLTTGNSYNAIPQQPHAFRKGFPYVAIDQLTTRSAIFPSAEISSL